MMVEPRPMMDFFYFVVCCCCCEEGSVERMTGKWKKFLLVYYSPVMISN